MGGAVFPPCHLPGPNYGGCNEDNGNVLQRSHACIGTLSAYHPAAGHHQPTPPLVSPGHSWASLGQSFVGSLPLYPDVYLELTV